MNYVEAVEEAKREIIDEYSRLLKVLLETKHLYQKVTINFDAVTTKCRKQAQPQEASHLMYFDKAMSEFAQQMFSPSSSLLTAIQRNAPNQLKATLSLKNVKMYCTVCESSEVYQPVWYTDAANEVLKRTMSGDFLEVPFKNNFQLLFLVFQCQRCKSDPEGFLIRRTGHSLSLDGRSPLEHIALLASIPKQERHLLSDAVVAYNAGKTLAALFYLRYF